MYSVGWRRSFNPSPFRAHRQKVISQPVHFLPQEQDMPCASAYRISSIQRPLHVSPLLSPLPPLFFISFSLSFFLLASLSSCSLLFRTLPSNSALATMLPHVSLIACDVKIDCNYSAICLKQYFYLSLNMCVGILKIRLAKDTFFFYQKPEIFLYNYYSYCYLNLLQFFSLRFFNRIQKLTTIIFIYDLISLLNIHIEILIIKLMKKRTNFFSNKYKSKIYISISPYH